MGIKVKVKRMSCLGSCLNRPILELKWSREERVYDIGEPEDESGGRRDDRDCPVETYWNAEPADNAYALGQISVSPADELYLEASTARLIDKTA